MDIPIGALIKPLKKLWDTVTYIFGDLKFEPKDIAFDKLNDYLIFSINICNNKNTKMYVKNIKMAIIDTDGNVEYRKVFQHVRDGYNGNTGNRTYEQFSSCTVNDRDIFVAKRLIVDRLTEGYVKDKSIYLEYDNHKNNPKKIEIKTSNNNSIL